MSMNLHCKEVELWQTPSYITHMCYSNNDGGWRGILYRYLTWVKRGGVFDSEDEYENHKAMVDSHVTEIEDVLKKKKQLRFSVI